MKLLNEIANEPETKTMIFVETKRKVDEIARAVTRYGYQALAIHGDKSQNDRDYVLNQFRVGRVNILVATDVAARGLGMFNGILRAYTLLIVYCTIFDIWS